MIDGSRIVCIPNDCFELSIWEQVNSDGCYSPDTNTIYILNPEHLCSTISHEFLHMVLTNWFDDELSNQLDALLENQQLNYMGISNGRK